MCSRNLLIADPRINIIGSRSIRERDLSVGVSRRIAAARMRGPLRYLNKIYVARAN